MQTDCGKYTSPKQADIGLYNDLSPVRCQTIVFIIINIFVNLCVRECAHFKFKPIK